MFPKVGGYVRRHHLAMLALFLARQRAQSGYRFKRSDTAACNEDAAVAGVGFAPRRLVSLVPGTSPALLSPNPPG